MHYHYLILENVLEATLHPPSPWSTFCLYGTACARHFIQMESCNMWPYVSSFTSHVVACTRTLWLSIVFITDVALVSQ
jgi:hypothetical protein